MANEKLEKLQALLKLTNEGLTRKEFLQFFEKVVNQILKLDIKLIEKINKAIKELDSKNSTSLETTQGELRALGGRFEVSLNKALKEQENGLNFIRDKVRRIKEGIDGKDGLDGIDGRDGQDGIGKEGKNGKDGKDFDPTDIEQLREELKQTKRLRGGGTSAMGVAHTFKYIAHTEQPSGLINGSNIEYTVAKAKNIWWIAGFTLNGEQIAELPNYTFVGNKITFSTAIPAAFSGKDFEIKYIGT